MAPIIPSGGKKMDWVRNPEAVEKKAQDMFDDDPQLDAIKDLPGMQDGIAELQEMTTDIAPPMDDMPPSDFSPIDAAPNAGATGGAVEQAIDKVRDAAQGVADAALKDAEKAVSDAVKNVGKPAAVPVSDVSGGLDDIKHEESETPEEEEKEESNKSESDDSKGGFIDDVPGVTGDDEDEGIEKESKDEEDCDKKDDKDGKDDKPCQFAASKGMRRLAELSADETKDLRHYWKDLLGFPPQYVDAMLKKYRA